MGFWGSLIGGAIGAKLGSDGGSGWHIDREQLIRVQESSGKVINYTPTELARVAYQNKEKVYSLEKSVKSYEKAYVQSQINIRDCNDTIQMLTEKIKKLEKIIEDNVPQEKLFDENGFNIVTGKFKIT